MTAPPPPDTADIDPLATSSMRFAPPLESQPSAEGVLHRTPTPFGLRWLHPARHRTTPNYRYDPERQIAVTPSGAPFAPLMTKDWTTTSYSTDGEDPPSSEEFGWEEM